jgi:lipoate---protein ligase
MQIIYSDFTSPAFNLAAEEYLFTSSTNDLLFLYRNESSVIVGNNQVVRNEVNIDFCIKNNIAILRRISGGGAVYHDTGNLNFCFISALNEGKSSLSADFLLPVVEILKKLNIPVEVGARKDLWLNGEYKVSGTASHISKNRELHHGTLLYGTQLDFLKESLSVNEKNGHIKGTASVPSEVTNIRSFLQNMYGYSVDVHGFVESLLSAFSTFYQTSVISLNQLEINEINILVNEKYSQYLWNFKK